jgi:hypothetical protein
LQQTGVSVLDGGILPVSFLKQAMKSNPVMSFSNSNPSCFLTHNGVFDIFKFSMKIDEKSKTGVAQRQAARHREVYS